MTGCYQILPTVWPFGGTQLFYSLQPWSTAITFSDYVTANEQTKWYNCTSKLVACFQTQGDHIHHIGMPAHKDWISPLWPAEWGRESVSPNQQFSSSTWTAGHSLCYHQWWVGRDIDWGRDYGLLSSWKPWARVTTSKIWTLEKKEHTCKSEGSQQILVCQSWNWRYVFPAQMPIVTFSDRFEF